MSVYSGIHVVPRAAEHKMLQSTLRQTNTQSRALFIEWGSKLTTKMQIESKRELHNHTSGQSAAYRCKGQKYTPVQPKAESDVHQEQIHSLDD